MKFCEALCKHEGSESVLTTMAGTLLCRYIQQCVRRFLRALYMRSRREAAAVIIGFMTMAYNANRLTHAFHRILQSIQTLRVRPC
jgi:hypothetical protein